MGVTIYGEAAAGWGGVADVLTAGLERGEDLGAAVAVFHRGRLVVDLAGGQFGLDGGVYDQRTLQLVFSTTKGITAIAVAMCVERGLLDYDAPVATYWPEFAVDGKGDATVAQLLSHQLGLISVDGLTLEQALDWDTVTGRLAASAPEWPIGKGHGYHALTYGWLAGELVRRVDGRSLGTFVTEEIASPLGVELWIGLPDSHEPRVSPLVQPPLPADLDPALKAMMEAFMTPGGRAHRTLTLSGAFEGDGTFNRREVHAAELPAANCITNATALATVYAATLGPVGGQQLIGDTVRDRARTKITPDGEPDLCLMMPTTFGLGFMVEGPFTTPYAGAGSYGHPGAGGSVAFAQPERQLAFAYVMNTMASNLAGDLRAQRLINATVAIADAI